MTMTQVWWCGDAVSHRAGKMLHNDCLPVSQHCIFVHVEVTNRRSANRFSGLLCFLPVVVGACASFLSPVHDVDNVFNPYFSIHDSIC